MSNIRRFAEFKKTGNSDRIAKDDVINSHGSHREGVTVLFAAPRSALLSVEESGRGATGGKRIQKGVVLFSQRPSSETAPCVRATVPGGAVAPSGPGGKRTASPAAVGSRRSPDDALQYKRGAYFVAAMEGTRS